MSLTEQASKLVIGDQMATSGENGSSTPTNDTPPAAKPKRVRTGCLTCRERHLKCDESLPNCQNCKKSNRQCKRGVRLNFIDTQVKDTKALPPSADWSIGFEDESRAIASEYKGGAGRYAPIEPDADDMDLGNDAYSNGSSTAMPVAPMISHAQLPPILSPPSAVPYVNQYDNNQYAQIDDPRSMQHHHHTHSTASTMNSSHSMFEQPQMPYNGHDQSHGPQSAIENNCLVSAEETLFMQVFVEEVGLWMDSMDSHKHVS